MGGPDAGKATASAEQDLRNHLNNWKGSYTAAVKEFAFILRVDGRFHRYTQEWDIVGAQPAKRKEDWLEVEIGVPEAWWREDDGKSYKVRLSNELEKGLTSMITHLQNNRHGVDSLALLRDWQQVKLKYLSTPYSL